MVLKAIFFDWTGTLTNEDGLKSGPVYLGREKEYNILMDHYYHKKISGKEFIIRVMKLWESISKNDIHKICSKFKLVSGAKEFIAFLKQRNIKCVLISKNSTVFNNEIGRILGMDYVYGTKSEFKDGRMTGELLELPKSKGEAIKDFQKENNLKKEECAAIGDDPDDIRMFDEVGLKLTYRGREEVKRAADYAVDSYEELIDIIKNFPV